jgi:inner membrane protein COX18
MTALARCTRFRPVQLQHVSSISLLTTTRPTSLLLQLPPLLRSRAFHASPRPQFVTEVVTELVTTSHSALTSIHSLTGLPWAYSIPLFALLLRTTLILPLSITTRFANRKQVALAPLLQAWRHTLRVETMKEVGHLGPVMAQRTLIEKMRMKRKEIYKRWGCGLWKNYLAILQMPVFLAVMEALRNMCGARQGWFGMITGWADGASDASSPGGNVDGVITGDGLLAPSPIGLEESLATEGALWFPNLLEADPQLILPFMLSASILLNLFGHQKVALGPWQTRFRRGMGVAALCVGPIMIHVPSALALYWVSSSLMAYGQALLIDWAIPIAKPVASCEPKRPMRTGLGMERPSAPSIEAKRPLGRGMKGKKL